MESRKENWKYFRHAHPEAHAAYEAFGKALGPEGGPLDAKTCALVKVGIAAASQYDLALRSHIEKALEAGCTPEEVEHAILQTATTAGFPRMMSALMIWREERLKY
jgi:alkylhydroperoxidase/carboxymuconolactone decarboxylase family protein YurZ